MSAGSSTDTDGAISPLWEHEEVGGVYSIGTEFLFSSFSVFCPAEVLDCKEHFLLFTAALSKILTLFTSYFGAKFVNFHVFTRYGKKKTFQKI